MLNKPNRAHESIALSPYLLIIVLSFSTGTCWAINFSIDLKLLWLTIFLIGITFLANLFSHKGRAKIPSFYLIAFFFFSIAALYAQPHVKAPDTPDHLYNLIPKRQMATLDGILAKMPVVRHSSRGYKSSLLMRIKYLHQAPPFPETFDNQAKIAKGLILLHLNGFLPENIEPGDRFVVKALVSRVTSFSTPGTFNYKTFLANRSIWVNGWIESPVNIIKLHDTVSSVQFANFNRLRYLPERIRANISSFLDKSLNQPSRGLYKAIIIGDRSDLSPSVLENFTKSGCVHILAISGVHMGLLSLLVIGVLTWLLKRSTWIILHIPVIKIATGTALLPLLIYALIAGFNTPVVRSLLMTSVFVIALLFDRPGSLPTHILLAALAILIWNPTSLGNVSFQLSFGAVIAIGMIYPKLYQYFFHDQTDNPLTKSYQINTTGKHHAMAQIFSKVSMTTKKWLLSGLILTTAAMLGTLPIIIFHFNRFSLVSPLTNLIVEPLVCLWSLVLGIVACLFIPFAPWFAKTLLQYGSWGLTGAERICAFFGSLPFSSYWLSTPTVIEIIFYYLFLTNLILYLYNYRYLQNYWLRFATFLLLCLLISAGYPKLTKHFDLSTSVSFLDVGQGTATLIQLPHDRNILIDGGGAFSDRFNIGERVIAPFLWKNKINRLDGLVITHPHADHFNGLPFIIQRFRPKIIWVNGDQEKYQDYIRLLKLANQLDIEIKTPSSEMLLITSGNASLRNISISSSIADESFIPISDTRYKQLNNPNNKSLVLRLDISEFSFLFPGDINSFMEKRLISEKKQLQADVLLAAHHGSRSSNSPDFVNAVDPFYLVISTGRQNPFLFTDPLPIENSSGKDMQVYTTANDGTVTFTASGGKISVSSYQVN
jgi:competence protein ComEC